LRAGELEPYVSRGSDRGAAASASHGPLAQREAFSYQGRKLDSYDPQTIERKWQQAWEEAGAFVTPNPDDPAHAEGRKAYVLEMLPYPSGELHMGHVLNYTLGDVVSHVRRRSGYSVLRPMGYDAFGLPAENAAIREGGHPREVTERNIEAIREQI